MMKFSRAICALSLATLLAACEQSPDAFATKADAEGYFNKSVFVGLQCKGLVDNAPASVKATPVREQGATGLAWVTLAAPYGADKCILEKKAICDSSGKVQDIKTIDHPCGSSAATQPAPAPSPDALATKADAQAWVGRNIVVGIQCSDILSIGGPNVEVSASGEDRGTTDNAQFTPWWNTARVHYGTTQKCTLEARAYCDKDGVVSRLETIDRPCP